MLNLKTFYISDQQYPIEKADSEQVINNVAALAGAGVKITLVIPRRWRTFGVSKQKRQRRIAEFYGVENSFRLKELISFPLTPLRMEKYAHALVAPLWAKITRQDIVYTRHPLPALISLLLGIKVLYETYRNYADHNQWLGKLLARASRKNNFLGVITHSRLAKQGLLKLGIEEEKVATIHNGFNPGLYNGDITKEQARKELNLPRQAKIACYSGRLDKEKGVDTLIDLAERTPEITCFLIGKSQKEPEGWIDETARTRGLTNIQHVPWVQIGELVKYLKASDLLLIPPTEKPLTKYGKTVLPLKLFLYLSAGRPILAPSLPDMLDVLNDKNAALVAPDNIDEAARAVRRIFSDGDWSDRLAKNARETSQNFTWQRRAERIFEFINCRLEAMKK